MLLDDPDQLERLAGELMARAATLRASSARELSTGDIELPEAEMERRLGKSDGYLRSYRRANNAPTGYWRNVGRTVLWLVKPTTEWVSGIRPESG